MLQRSSLVAALALLTGAGAAAGQLPSSALGVITAAGREIVWWRSERAPTAWSAPDPAVAGATSWRGLRPGLELGRLQLSGGGLAWRISVVLARVDPALYDLQLVDAAAGGAPGWSIEAMPAKAALAVNAGQFQSDRPWGWLVHERKELQPPGRGPLSSAFVVDSAGRVELVDADSIQAVRERGGALEAFQSYPAVLVGDGVVPEALRAPGRGVDLQHRDSRLGMCTLRDGRLLLALTRFAVLGDAFSRLPFGPTTPEMAALMGALGCRRAVLLDGGLSGQLAARDAHGNVQRWRGLRRVPLGLVAYPAAAPARRASRP